MANGICSLVGICFRVYHPQRRTFFLCTDTEKNAKSWVEAMNGELPFVLLKSHFKLLTYEQLQRRNCILRTRKAVPRKEIRINQEIHNRRKR